MLEEFKHGVKYLNREERLRMVMINALSRGDKLAIEYFQNEYHSLKEKTDLFIEGFMEKYEIVSVKKWLIKFVIVMLIKLPK